MKYLLLFLFVPVMVFSQDETLIDSLENELQNLHNHDRFAPLFSLVQLYAQSDLQRSNAYAHEYFHLADSLEDQYHLITALNAVAITYNMLGENFKALDYLEMIIPELEQAIRQDPENNTFTFKLATAYNNKANILTDIGEKEEAIEMYYQAEKYISDLLQKEPEKENFLYFQAGVFNNIGLLHFHAHRWDEAYEILEQALHISEVHQFDDQLATTLNNLAMVKVNQGNLSEALSDYKRALPISQAMGDGFTIVANLENQGWVFEGLMQFDSALIYKQRSVDISREMDYPYGLANSLCNLGALQTILEQWDEAESSLLEARDIALNTGILEIQDNIYENLYFLYSDRGEFELANEYLLMHIKLSDSLFDIETSNQLSFWQTRYNTEKIENENLILTQETEIQKLQIARKNSQLIWLIAGSMSLLIFVVVIYLLYRQRDKAYRNIVKQNQEIVAFERRIHEEALEVDKAFDTTINESDQENLLKHQLETYMEEDKPYLSHQLNRNDICKKLNTNRSYLSKIINDHFQLNFNTWINEYRVKEARRMLSDIRFDHLSIEGIGDMAGFNTKASFHANFKKMIGVTPQYYRQKRSLGMS